MHLNDNLLIISGGLISVTEPLALGDDVVMIVHGTVIEEKKVDNQDGTYNSTVRVRGTIAEVRNKQGKVISEQEEQE